MGSAAGSYEPLPVPEQEELLPRVLPAGWERLEWPTPAFGCHGDGALRGLMVLIDGGVEEDGRRWLHVSLSRRGRVPSWEDVAAVKELFVGRDRVAYQVIAPADEHFSLPDGPGRLGKVLHMWSPLDGEPPLPNFLRSRGGTL